MNIWSEMYRKAKQVQNSIAGYFGNSDTWRFMPELVDRQPF